MRVDGRKYIESADVTGFAKNLSAPTDLMWNKNATSGFADIISDDGPSGKVHGDGGS